MGVWIETLSVLLLWHPMNVTPFVGVWIETWFRARHRPQRRVTPFVGVWIETQFTACVIISMSCHTLRGCVDWNVSMVKSSVLKNSHTLRGCVDWNMFYNCLLLLWSMSHPSWVCGLKPFSFGNTTPILCHTLRGCVDWNLDKMCVHFAYWGHTLRGCVDWNCFAGRTT